MSDSDNQSSYIDEENREHITIYEPRASHFLAGRNPVCPICGCDKVNLYRIRIRTGDVNTEVYRSFRCEVCGNERYIQKFDLNHNLIEGRWSIAQIDINYPPDGWKPIDNELDWIKKRSEY